MSVQLTGTAHFTLEEVRRAQGAEWPIPAEYQGNAQRTLEKLEEVRAALNVPLLLTSLWRSREHNDALPGSSPTSQHLTADAADVVPQGLALEDAAVRWQHALDSGNVGPFGQFIVEQDAVDGLRAHVHVGTGSKGESLVRLASGAYERLAEWLGDVAGAAQQFAQEHDVAAAGVAAVAGFCRPGHAVRREGHKPWAPASHLI